MVAVDGATGHGANTHGEAKLLYDALDLQNEHFKKKGIYVRQSALFSIVDISITC